MKDSRTAVARAICWLAAMTALLAAGCGGKHHATQQPSSASPSTVSRGHSQLDLPQGFAATGIEQYWEQASRSALPYSLPEPASEKVPSTSRPTGSPQKSPPAGEQGEVTPQGGVGSIKTAEASAAATGRWKGASMKPFASTEGKVFFDAPNKRGKLISYVCSGTALNSENQSVVWTAGHCVHDGAPPRVLENPHWQADFHKNWVFAPGYHVGMDCAGRPKCSAPLGYWRPRQGQVITLSGWSRYGSLLYDLGAVVLQKKNGHTLFDAIGGGQGIAFTQAVKATYWSFGYPAEAPFSGESLFYCRSGLQFRDRPVEIRVWKGKYVKAPQQIAGPSRIGIRCNMTGGSSGGGWLTRFDRTWGYVTGVNSTGDDKFMSSPYLGDAAANLWTAVRKR